MWMILAVPATPWLLTAIILTAKYYREWKIRVEVFNHYTWPRDKDQYENGSWDAYKHPDYVSNIHWS